MNRSGIQIKKSREGLLHKNLDVPQGKNIPESELEEAKHSQDPKIRKRANFALNAKKWKKPSLKKLPLKRRR